MNTEQSKSGESTVSVSPIEFQRYVFILFNVENDLSAAAVDTGNVRGQNAQESLYVWEEVTIASHKGVNGRMWSLFIGHHLPLFLPSDQFRFDRTGTRQNAVIELYAVFKLFWLYVSAALR